MLFSASLQAMSTLPSSLPNSNSSDLQAAFLSTTLTHTQRENNNTNHINIPRTNDQRARGHSKRSSDNIPHTHNQNSTQHFPHSLPAHAPSSALLGVRLHSQVSPTPSSPTPSVSRNGPPSSSLNPSDRGSTSSSIFHSTPGISPAMTPHRIASFNQSWYPTPSSAIKHSPYLVKQKQTLTEIQRLPRSNTSQLSLINSETLANIIYQPSRARKLLWFLRIVTALFIGSSILVYAIGKSAYGYTVQVALADNQLAPIGLQLFWSFFFIFYCLFTSMITYQAYQRRMMFPFKSRPFPLLLISSSAGVGYLLVLLFRVLFDLNPPCWLNKVLIDLLIPCFTLPYIVRAVQLICLFSKYTLSHKHALFLFIISLFPFMFLSLFSLFSSNFNDLDEFLCGSVESAESGNPSLYQSSRSKAVALAFQSFLFSAFIVCLVLTKRVWDPFQIKHELLWAASLQFCILLAAIFEVSFDSFSDQQQVYLYLYPLLLIRPIILFYVSFAFPLYESYALIQFNSSYSFTGASSGENNDNSERSSISLVPNFLKFNSSPSSDNLMDYASLNSVQPRPSPNSPQIESEHTLLSVIGNLTYFDYFKDYMCSANSPYALLWEFYISCVLYADTEEISERLSLGRYICETFFNEQTFNGKSQFSQWFYLIVHRLYLSRTVHNPPLFEHFPNQFASPGAPSSHDVYNLSSPSPLHRNMSATSSSSEMDAAQQQEQSLITCEKEINTLIKLFCEDSRGSLSRSTAAVSIPESSIYQMGLNDSPVDSHLFLQWQECVFEVMDEWCWKGFLYSKEYKAMCKQSNNEAQIKQRLHQASII